MFSLKEFEALKKYIQSGRSVFVILNEGGEAKLNTNINYLLEQFGMSCNSDSVVRTSFYKYLHPKESFISHGNMSEDFTRICRGQSSQGQSKAGPGSYADKYKEDEKDFKKEGDGSGISIVYSYGSTIST